MDLLFRVADTDLLAAVAALSGRAGAIAAAALRAIDRDICRLQRPHLSGNIHAGCWLDLLLFDACASDTHARNCTAGAVTARGAHVVLLSGVQLTSVLR